MPFWGLSRALLLGRIEMLRRSEIIVLLLQTDSKNGSKLYRGAGRRFGLSSDRHQDLFVTEKPRAKH
jgi:hypothetical protein